MIPKTPEAFFDRLAREMRRFEATWNAAGSIEMQSAATGEVGTAVVTASQGGNWRVTTDFHFLTLDSIVARDFARPLPVRLLKYLVAFLDYVSPAPPCACSLQGWRFGLYFLYPLAVTLAFFLVALAAISLVLRSAAIESARSGNRPCAFAATLALLATLGRRWSITHLMDLWSFSLNYLRGRRPDADALIGAFRSDRRRPRRRKSLRRNPADRPQHRRRPDPRCRGTQPAHQSRSGARRCRGEHPDARFDRAEARHAPGCTRLSRQGSKPR